MIAMSYIWMRIQFIADYRCLSRRDVMWEGWVEIEYQDMKTSRIIYPANLKASKIQGWTQDIDTEGYNI